MHAVGIVMGEWRRQEFVLGCTLEARSPRARERLWGGEEAASLWERCELSQRGSERSLDRKCILDALKAQKTRLVAANVV